MPTHPLIALKHHDAHSEQMKLHRLEIKGLYGFMDKTISFHRKLNLLVGINGSGKTSVLNVISWLMQPNFPELCTTEFKQLRLFFAYEGNTHIITCNQTDDKIQIIVSINGAQQHPISVALRVPAAYLANNSNAKESFNALYEKIQPQSQETHTWMYFSRLPNPIIVSIDRKFDHKSEKSNEQRFKKSVALHSSSLEIVKAYSNEAYTRYNKKVIDLNKVLRDKILLSSFESSVIDFRGTSGSENKLSVEDVNRLEVNIINFLEDDSSDKEMSQTLKKAIRKYSSDMRTIINDYFSLRQSTDSKSGRERRIAPIATSYLINSNQFVRIEKLLKAFSKYEQDSNESYQEISTYLKSINHFLKDSSKELFFKKETGQLYFNLRDRNNKEFKFEQNIDNLSSGEKQILMLFTYLAFGDTKGKIFIIDEPEISLHPKWQDDFLQQLNNVTPSDTQLVIATHSPSIVGDLEENCKVLLPYNE